MKNHPVMWRVLTLVAAFFAAMSLTFAPVLAPDFNLTPVFAGDDDDDDDGDSSCSDLPSFADLTAALDGVVTVGVGATNGGLANNMWGTEVNRVGIVCEVTKTGPLGDQWPGSRVISAQKANTANAFSLPGGPATSVGFGAPLSTANLYATVQPGASLFGLQFSNPVDFEVAYDDTDEDAEDFGTDDDPMKGEAIGGVNVFGGGLALYNSDGDLVGGLGVSGDTSCTDHIIAWKTRDALGLDFVPGGVSATGDDNIIFIGDATTPLQAAFTHPLCDAVGTPSSDIARDLPACFPIGAVVGPVSGAAPSCP